jgi:hypothetical protein
MRIATRLLSQGEDGRTSEFGGYVSPRHEKAFIPVSMKGVVPVPAELEEGIAVLAEPLSVAVKAIDEAVRVQMARLPDALATPNWLHDRRCLVTGLGPVGLLVLTGGPGSDRPIDIDGAELVRGMVLKNPGETGQRQQPGAVLPDGRRRAFTRSVARESGVVNPDASVQASLSWTSRRARPCGRTMTVGGGP